MVAAASLVLSGRRGHCRSRRELLEPVERGFVELEQAGGDRGAAGSHCRTLREEAVREARRRAGVEPVDVDGEHASDRVRDRFDLGGAVGNRPSTMRPTYYGGWKTAAPLDSWLNAVR